jgi:hypothetical protein
VVCIKGGSNQLLTNSGLKAWRLTYWWGSWVRSWCMPEC